MVSVDDAQSGRVQRRGWLGGMRAWSRVVARYRQPQSASSIDFRGVGRRSAARLVSMHGFGRRGRSIADRPTSEQVFTSALRRMDARTMSVNSRVVVRYRQPQSASSIDFRGVGRRSAARLVSMHGFGRRRTERTCAEAGLARRHARVVVFADGSLALVQGHDHQPRCGELLSGVLSRSAAPQPPSAVGEHTNTLYVGAMQSAVRSTATQHTFGWLPSPPTQSALLPSIDGSPRDRALQSTQGLRLSFFFGYFS
uniref:Uncharacterized protein n=1 Tax=Plectus sambesii TaxID=2011161 RepID=A0A914V1Z4_9BILA